MAEASAHVVDPLIPSVLLLTPWYGGSKGGVAVATETLAQSLTVVGASCVVIEVVGDGWIPRVRRGSGGEMIVTLCVRDPSDASTLLRRVAARLRAGVARVVVRAIVHFTGARVAHFHYAVPQYGIWQQICSSVGLKLVATFHGSATLAVPQTRAATAQLLAACGAVTTVSHALQEKLLEIFPDVAPITRVVHNAVPTGLMQHVTAMQPRDRDIDILFVGNLIPIKGVDVLLRALALVEGDVDPLRVTIVGDGSEQRALHALALDLGLSETIHFIGRQERDALPELYSRTRILAVPSRIEPFGLVVLEGQICGAAVIASAVGGILEIIIDRETGMLVPPEDPVALAEGIRALLTGHGVRDALARGGRIRATEVFSPSAMARRYAEVYRSVL